MEIRYLKRKEVNNVRWDATVAASGRETIYPYSWYLDRVAVNWSALVMGDYEYLMPLVWKRKWGVPLLYQPFYTQQLGIFSRHYVDPHLVSRFLARVPSRFRWAEINFNAGNLVSEAPELTGTDRTNYVLDLRDGYGKISAGYSTNARRNIRKAEAFGDSVSRDLTVSDLIALKRKHDVVDRGEKDYQWLQALLEDLVFRKSGIIYSAGEGEGADAAAFFSLSRQRAIYLVSVSSDTGKERRCMFRIVDQFIRDHAGSGLVLDFEGSMIPSVARFFAGFGAGTETYQHVGFRRFPFNLLNR